LSEEGWEYSGDGRWFRDQGIGGEGRIFEDGIARRGIHRG
jgi:hypothetical protein